VIFFGEIITSSDLFVTGAIHFCFFLLKLDLEIVDYEAYIHPVGLGPSDENPRLAIDTSR
jgi:hypothetical protein